MHCIRNACILDFSYQDQEVSGMGLGTSHEQPVGVDTRKIEQIRNLKNSGFSAEQIADQVDLDISIVREVISLMD
jgi:predicted transposase YdaD